jgi:hypothetical protein
MRSSAPLLLAALCACAGAQRRADCDRAGGEQELVAKKARSCAVPPLPLLSARCAEACGPEDARLLREEVECIGALPSCSDPRECRGESCAEAMPGSDDRFREQLEGCLRKRAQLTPGCRESLAR